MDNRPNRYKKKPVIIEAFQFTADSRTNNSQWPDWLHSAWQKEPSQEGAVFLIKNENENRDGGGAYFCKTLEGIHKIALNDYIIRGIKGEIYPCKTDIFKMTYDPVD